MIDRHPRGESGKRRTGPRCDAREEYWICIGGNPSYRILRCLKCDGEWKTRGRYGAALPSQQHDLFEQLGARP